MRRVRRIMVSICATTVLIVSTSTSFAEGRATVVLETRQQPLNPAGTVLLDKQNNRLLVKAEVVLREGQLEYLACLKNTKEHESILAVDGKAETIHAGLLTLGAKSGTPAKSDGAFQIPTGQEITINLTWTDDKGIAHREPAQSWIRRSVRRYFLAPLSTLPKDLQLPGETGLKWDEKARELSWYGAMSAAQHSRLLKLTDDRGFRAAIESLYEQSKTRGMEARWVFAGSGFAQDEQGRRQYLAESGDLICVANFPTAMIDVASKSSAANDDLMFEAFAEKIPPVGTKITIELVPVLNTDSK